MVTNKILALVGKSASGKNAILNGLVECGLYRWISYTTRPPRVGEINDYDYHFCDLETFNKLNVVDRRVYNTLVGGNPETWYYGHDDEPNTIKADCGVIVDVEGLKQLITKYGSNRIYSVYVDVDDDIRKARCKARGDFDETEWDRRLVDDTVAFKEAEKLVNLVVRNNTCPLSVTIASIEYNFNIWLRNQREEQIKEIVEQYQLVIRNIIETTDISLAQAKTLSYIFGELIDLAQKGLT